MSVSFVPAIQQPFCGFGLRSCVVAGCERRPQTQSWRSRPAEPGSFGKTGWA